MQEIYANKSVNEADNKIDPRELFNVLWQGKWIIVSFTAFLSIIGVVYSLLLPNIYESRALLVPASTSSGISGALGNYSGLAGLAGINLPASADGGNSRKAISKISSLSFFENNIMPNIYLPHLMAIKSWNSRTNAVIFDNKIYDKSSNTWISGYSPSAQESFKVFKSKLSLSEDKMTGFITLSIKHQSPFVAKQWAELVVSEINGFYRQKDKAESERAISYLNKQISSTGFSEIKQAIAQLIQGETKKLTIMEASKSYVFDYIDPPKVMEKKSEPARALICILSALLGGFLSIFAVLLRHYYLLSAKII